MKNHLRKSFLTPPRVLLASVAVALTSASPAFAQSGGAGSTKYGTNPTTPSTSPTTTGTNDNTRRNNEPASTTGAPYQSRAAADVDATTETNTRNAKPSTTGRDKLSWGDRRFVTKAADGGHAEVQLAQLAAQRATNPEVKSFAQKLVDDHTKANSELMSLASQKNVKVDADDDKDRAYKRLNKKSGADFDQEFVEHMIDEHEKDIKMFEKASTDAKDADVRSFASKQIAALRGHLQQAEGLRQSVMPTGHVDDSSGRSTPGGTTSSGLGTSSTGATGSSSGTTSSDPIRKPNGSR